MVTANGELITASESENIEYFWAARGAGPGMFAVVTRYHLKLYDLPQHITCSSYIFPIDEVTEVASWLQSIAASLSPSIELSLFMLTAPSAVAERATENNGKVCMVTATCFANSVEEAQEYLAPFASCPLADKALGSTSEVPYTFERLFDESGALWPENHRNHVETIFSNSDLVEIFAALKDHFIATPSKTTLILFSIFTGPNVPAPLPNTAFSMSARFYGGAWTMWTDKGDDDANARWHSTCISLLQPYVAGRYVAETDTVAYADHAKSSYKPANFKLLAALRLKHDPDGVFFGFFNGLD